MGFVRADIAQECAWSAHETGRQFTSSHSTGAAQALNLAHAVSKGTAQAFSKGTAQACATPARTQHMGIWRAPGRPSPGVDDGGVYIVGHGFVGLERRCRRRGFVVGSARAADGVALW
eukprot:350889-Chlamydomonas_euryale.AAC.3